MKIFVTGASGFIGSHVVRLLLSRGHSVAILSSMTEVPRRLKEVFSKIEKKTGKLEDLRSLRQLLTDFKPDACVHLAWYAEPGKYLEAAENLSSLKMSLDLFNELIQSGCRQIVAAGTCAEYAVSSAPLKEDSRTEPATLYAAAKFSCCLLGRQLADLAKINFAWGRIFYPYGPTEDERRVVPAVIKSLLEGKPFSATAGDQVRDYIHVEDVALAFCIMAEQQANGVFNVSSGSPVSIRHLLETIGRLNNQENLLEFGVKPYRSWEPPFIGGDNQKLKSLNWREHYNLEEGLQNTIEWWENHFRP